MRYKQPKTEMGASGIYGGVGSRPGREPWTPGGRRRKAKAEWVPKALRKLRIRRSRPRPVDSHKAMIWPALLVFGLILILILAYLGGAER